MRIIIPDQITLIGNCRRGQSKQNILIILADYPQTIRINNRSSSGQIAHATPNLNQYQKSLQQLLDIA